MSFVELMPPWAHTLCERFTGTIEIRSTSTFISASFTAVESPASPPPTMITRFLAAAISTHFFFQIVWFGISSRSRSAEQFLPLGFDEREVMQQVLLVLLHLNTQRDLADLVMHTRAIE